MSAVVPPEALLTADELSELQNDLCWLRSQAQVSAQRAAEAMSIGVEAATVLPFAGYDETEQIARWAACAGRNYAQAHDYYEQAQYLQWELDTYGPAADTV